MIAWKAALDVLPVKKMYAISSIRLPYETEKPDCKCTLYFGEKDNYKPSVNWHADLALDCNFVEYGEHEMYREEGFAKSLCQKIIKELITQQNSLENEPRDYYRSDSDIRKTNPC